MQRNWQPFLQPLGMKIATASSSWVLGIFFLFEAMPIFDDVSCHCLTIYLGKQMLDVFQVVYSHFFFFFFWWGLLHGPQQGPDRMKEKT